MRRFDYITCIRIFTNECYYIEGGTSVEPMGP